MRRIFTSLVVFTFFARLAGAQVLMSSGTYSQNFDSLANSGSPSWTDNATLPGWYVSQSVAPNNITNYTAGSGTSTTGGIYSFGTNDANGITDRALGSLASGTPGNLAFGVCFTNDTASSQGNLTISYTGEEWRNGGNTNAQQLTFFYLTSSSPITNSDAVNVNTWTAFTALNFTTPTTGATSAALDGNNPANQQVFTNVVLTNVVVLAGQEIFLRWFDTNDSGLDHGVAVDNLTVSFSAVTNSPVTNASVISTQTRIIRIVTYNIEADIGVTNKQPTFTNIMTTANAGPPLPGLLTPPTDTNNYAAGGALAGIGEELLNGNAQPLDILALEETTSNPATVVPIVTGLNIFYGVAGMYSNSTYQATESGNNPSVGNGPNAIVFNTRTVQLVASVPVDPPGGTSQLGGVSSSKSGEYREVMRYQFAPAGVPTTDSNTFYIYVSHYKSGASSTANNTNSRAGEAGIIRTNMMTTLPVGARILHVGDFNTGEANELMYATLIAPGTNQLLDPLNPLGNLTTNWDDSSTALLPAKTDSVISLQYRDDYQMMTTNVYFGTPGGLALVAGTYHPFGNNGTTAYLGSANSGANTALNNKLVTNGPVFISAAQLYVDLTGGGDHLPVVADYTIPIPAPRFSSVNLSGTNLVLGVMNGMTNSVYTLLMSTNLTVAIANWTAVASNTASGGTFSFTATNAVNRNALAQFFLLRTK